MKGIILAAGRGSRMGGLTADHPKGMIKVGGKSLLEWQMSALRSAGVEDICIVRGYRGDAMRYAGVTYLDNVNWERTNMVSSLLVASDILGKEPCVVSYADIVYSADAVANLLKGEGDVRITYDVKWLELWKLRFDDPLSDAESFRLASDGTLAEIGNRAKTLEEIEGQYMGLLYFNPNGWKRILAVLGEMDPQRVDKLDMTSLLRTLLPTCPVHAVPNNDLWFEFDSARDVEIFRTLEDRFSV